MASAAAAREIPENALFRIGEVSRLTETKTFVLRFWESEFPSLQPVKSPAGHRLYRREDLETVFAIKRLLYEEGFTIAGAKHLGEKMGGNGAAAAEPDISLAGISTEENAHTVPSLARPQPAARSSPQASPKLGIDRQVLVDVREELLAVLTLLKDE